jgi:hypothetical protein
MILVYIFLACSTWGKLPTGEFILCGSNNQNTVSYVVFDSLLADNEALSAFLMLLSTPFFVCASIFDWGVSVWAIFYFVIIVSINMANIVTLLVAFTWIFMICCPLVWAPPAFCIVMCIYPNCVKFMPSCVKVLRRAAVADRYEL